MSTQDWGLIDHPLDGTLVSDHQSDSFSGEIL